MRSNCSPSNGSTKIDEDANLGPLCRVWYAMLIRQLRQLPVAPWSVTPSTGTPFGLEMRPEGKHGRRELDELEAIRLIGPSATSAPLLTPLCGQFFRYTEITFLIRDF